jgi:SIR2-like domain
MGPSAAAPNVGHFSKRTLLTGAGWTRNWGERLASEVWEDLIGHHSVQGNSRLRELLLNEQSFEVALGATRCDPFTDADRQVFERALLDVFVSMDREIARHDHDPWINIYGVQKLIYRFWKGHLQNVDSGYIFTLNQDLWPERHLYNHIANGTPCPSLPGLLVTPNQQFFSSVMDIGSRDLTMQPVATFAESMLRGNFNIIKLHGSFNWRTADALGAMVVGTGKVDQIASSPLLAWYFDIFRNVLSAGGVRLMIIGYGFGDEHVNAVIAEAIEHHDLKVFIWDVGSNLKQRIMPAPHGAVIWNGLLTTASRQMIDVFPSNQADTQESIRISETFFGE